jgi:hypothetical protein
MKRAALLGAVVVGLVLAAWHLAIARQALFVFREGEPVTSWLALLLGPALTVLGCLLALFRPIAAGVVVVTGGLASAAAFIVGDGGLSEHTMAYVLQFTAPMLAIGIALMLLARRSAYPGGSNAT